MQRSLDICTRFPKYLPYTAQTTIVGRYILSQIAFGCCVQTSNANPSVLMIYVMAYDETRNGVVVSATISLNVIATRDAVGMKADCYDVADNRMTLCSKAMAAI